MHIMNVVLQDKNVAQVATNSDWSGDAIVSWTDRKGEHRQVSIPGSVLLAISHAATKENITSKLIGFLEQL